MFSSILRICVYNFIINIFLRHCCIIGVAMNEIPRSSYKDKLMLIDGLFSIECLYQDCGLRNIERQTEDHRE